jgi:hypothetical protein
MSGRGKSGKGKGKVSSRLIPKRFGKGMKWRKLDKDGHPIHPVESITKRDIRRLARRG